MRSWHARLIACGIGKPVEHAMRTVVIQGRAAESQHVCRSAHGIG
jgi:hypothetical protein